MNIYHLHQIFVYTRETSTGCGDDGVVSTGGGFQRSSDQPLNWPTVEECVWGGGEAFVLRIVRRFFGVLNRAKPNPFFDNYK